MIKKRKNIDLTPDAIRLLGYMAVRDGVSFKTYIENMLEKQACKVDEDAILLAMSKEEEANIPASEEEEREIRAILNASVL